MKRYSLRHCEQSEAIQPIASNSGLPRRVAPRNDKSAPCQRLSYDVVVIGSGAAGLRTALNLAPLKVALLTKTESLISGSTAWAQGGIAAATQAPDSAASHAEDTMIAGARHNNPLAVRALTEGGAKAIRELEHAHMPFDRNADGSLAIGHEAAHSHRRVLHAGGDATGRKVSETLTAQVEKARHIDVFTHTMATRLIDDGRALTGVLAFSKNEGWIDFATSRVVLATGGIGQVFSVTTNPKESTGDGLALALQAGVAVADLEFVQFHPTALAIEGLDQQPLLTEALRGEGAKLLNSKGERFMQRLHADAELAPRDVVARGIWAQLEAGEKVYLDARHLSAVLPTRFPTVMALCAAHHLNPQTDLLPIAPAAHYHMGGVMTDLSGRTSLNGLWAVGEVAHTGVHGANRLASNSLLECLVFAEKVALSVKDYRSSALRYVSPQPQLPEAAWQNVGASIRGILYQHAGLVRNEHNMRVGLEKLADIRNSCGGLTAANNVTFTAIENYNRWLVAVAVLRAALARPESLGAHCRNDAVSTTQSQVA